MPHIPDSTHDTHDLELVAAFAAGDATGADLERATALVAACTDCAAVHADLRAIAAALPELEAPVRARDFRLSPAQAASLRPSGIRGLLAALSGPRFSFATPVGTGLAALGIVGVLVASGGLSTGAGAAIPASPESAAELAAGAAEASDGIRSSEYGAAQAAPSAAASAAPVTLEVPSEEGRAYQKGSGDAFGTGLAADAPDPATAAAWPGPVAAASLVAVFLGFALLAARLVSRRLARAP